MGCTLGGGLLGQTIFESKTLLGRLCYMTFKTSRSDTFLIYVVIDRGDDFSVICSEVTSLFEVESWSDTETLFSESVAFFTSAYSWRYVEDLQAAIQSVILKAEF